MQVQPDRDGNDDNGLSTKAIVAIVLGALGLIFIFQNTGSGKINLLFWDVRAPTWLWLLVLFIAGVIVGSLFPWGRRRKKA